MAGIHQLGDKRRGACPLSICRSNSRRCCGCFSWVTLRPRTRRGIWFRNAIAVLAAYLFLDFLIPHLGRLDLSTQLTWFDLGWYGFMPTRQYHSFEHTSPDVEFLQVDARCSQDHIVFAPRGPAVRDPGGIILDHTGELVWRHSGFEGGDTQDLRVQEYRGEKFLTFWVGEQSDGQKKGAWYMMDNTYTVRHQIHCKGGLSCDMHEFQITPNGTALLAIYSPLQADLSSIDSSASGWLLDCRFQEIDIETGDLLFEWIASEHVDVDETYRSLEHCSSDPGLVFDGCGYYKSSAFDFYHINSLQKDAQGNYLVSARNTHTITYVDGQTGDIIWILGGKKNSFKDLSDGAATNFAWQHHARWLDENTLSLFDNAHHDWHDTSDAASRGMIVDLDVDAHTAALRAEYTHPTPLQSQSQGNAQVLDSGNVFVGWGRCAAFSEFAADGALLCDAHFGASAFYSFGPVSSYRVFREAWTGAPSEPPSVVVESGSVFVSWNGATEVKTWRVEGASTDEAEKGEWNAVLQVRKKGFETEIRLPLDVDYAALRIVGLDADGAELGASEEVEWSGDGVNWLESPLVLVIVSGVAVLSGIVVSIVGYFIWRRDQMKKGHGHIGGRRRRDYRLLGEHDEGRETNAGDGMLLQQVER